MAPVRLTPSYGPAVDSALNCPAPNSNLSTLLARVVCRLGVDLVVTPVSARPARRTDLPQHPRALGGCGAGEEEHDCHRRKKSAQHRCLLHRKTQLFPRSRYSRAAGFHVMNALMFRPDSFQSAAMNSSRAPTGRRSEERRVGKEGRYRGAPTP